MVEEVVGNIIEAEDKAEQIKKEAREEAKQILSASQKASDERRAQTVKDCRALNEERKKATAEKAEKAYAEVYEQGKTQADSVNAAYDKNVEKAVQFVVSAVIG